MSVAAPQSMSSSAPRAEAPARSPFARVETYDDPARALRAWRDLSPESPGSYYQTEPFLLAWLEIFAPRRKATPFFVVAYDAAGAPLAFLPLGLFRFGPLRVAQFLGGKHSNYNLGLFRAGADFSAQDLRRLLRAAAHSTPGGPHLYRLLNLPLLWRGAVNPLTWLDHQPAASRAHAAHLPADGDAFLASRLSTDTRKKLRKKEKRLAAMGALHYFRARDPQEKRYVLDAFFRHKIGRPEFALPEAELDATRRFYRALASGESGAELHALALDDRIIAVLGAGAAGSRLQGMFISYDPDPEIAKSSPGEILLTHVLRDACARKFAAFDLGVGDARYKASFCDEAEPLADALYAPTAGGRLALPFFTLAAAAKRIIKRNPKLLALAEKIQRR
ncbi:GNAT family N-acetyltransferase [Rhodoblastus acidophilus]|uniref:GNAT family N-acetyltransferase n=1 Tax=Candidatus Rhodoblastus alkanivorans TaxID=2954117 RepID=A0ABS9Z5P9_9HYPH|nr:GNAT family N-acetyltransferase [Candidatus Rhodoblastus alkanivorans]MCI4680302.1 GNAT family N-acetyltransferase [Candidatus Rhodoblastus alkanivorans]MCI4682791.1 GNAT family N-acetyltransferase [Candidatus Rhodoblastus alkanivorans]MDI4640098.1 GNAT family N-acetyltransferase [Rhodoblastus acidophilus]